ncbi:hypothetical protein [Streptomyces enissocaesilis]|uniref:Minor tail protein n=1 Tax=Streptomyces enissocaesilis TaxID=332589 RepID=A0ABN3XMW6_9ACTN
MPMIVNPQAPQVTPPARVTSPDQWLAAIVDKAWAGVVLSVNYTAGAPLANAVNVRKVRLTRTNPSGELVQVRSGDPAWAIEGVGAGYDHEAPLGVPVIYTATPIYADGSTGPSSSLSVTVPAPQQGENRDLWIKSIDNPGLSLRCMIIGRPAPSSAGRQDTTDIAGSPYPALAYDTHGAEVYQVTVDVPPERVDQLRALLRSGLLLSQVRPGYLWPDAFFVPGDITGPTPTGHLGTSSGYQFSFTIQPLERPATTDQPLRIPGWSWDELARRFGTWDAVAASYSSWASLSTNGIT